MASKSQRGFTLIELLVVISIIALLLSVLLPALQKAKALAKAAVCTTRQKQLVLAGIMYANENNGHISSCYELNAALPGVDAQDYKKGLWFVKWAPYIDDPDYLTEVSKNWAAQHDVRDIELLYCPSAPKVDESLCTNPQFQMYLGNYKSAWGYVGFEGGFSLNAWVEKDVTVAWPGIRTGLGDHVVNEILLNRQYQWAKSDVPIISDGSWISSVPFASQPDPPDAKGPQYGTASASGDPLSDAKIRNWLDRHDGSQVMAFGDGHAEKVRLERVWEDYSWHNRWNKYLAKRPE